MAVTHPIVTAGIRASGGASSVLDPLLPFVASFFPPRLIWRDRKRLIEV